MATGVDARLLKSTKFPAEFSQKVDMQKVNLQVMKKWIASKISDILGNEDDVVIELVFNLIEGPRYPDIKSLQIQLTGFLDKDTALFCKDLWKLLLSAQSSPQGVPKELLEAKKLELMQEKVHHVIEADRAAESAKQRRDDWDRRDREVADMKDRDRRDRAATRGDTWQGRRGDRDFDNRGRGGGFRRGGRTRMGAIVMFLEVDEVVAGLIKAGGSPLHGLAQHQLHLDRALGVVVHRAILINLIGDRRLYRREGGEKDERGRGHPEETRTEAVPTDVRTGVVQVDHRDPYRQTVILLQQNVDDTPHQEVAQYPVAEGRQEVSLRRGLTLAAGVEVATTAAAAAAQAVHPQTPGPREAKTTEGADGGLRREETRPRAVDGIVLQLLHDPGFETSQLMFLKMNLVPRRPGLR
ncbi:serine arginine repetitive matrix 1 [Fusarium longipes]|uniref:Serine arginine repetitive matrix 1 n=1 Tax=Fusarium longipes TaxID=694270 RepID=A0A395RQR6_9HYPO|nr:serine arginine repetitive matrix 1 [Fusarium longipes]